MLNKKLLDISNATVYCDEKKVFDGLSVAIRNGESSAIIGPNGASKSTLLKLLSREIYPVSQQGSFVKKLGKELPTLWELREKIRLVSADLQISFVPEISGLDIRSTHQYLKIIRELLCNGKNYFIGYSSYQ